MRAVHTQRERTIFRIFIVTRVFPRKFAVYPFFAYQIRSRKGIHLFVIEYIFLSICETNPFFVRRSPPLLFMPCFNRTFK